MPAGFTQTTAVPGPGLTVNMGEASLVAALNAWGTARDQELLDLKSDLGATQVGVSVAFNQAPETLQNIATNFRAEAETMRLHSQYEPAQPVARFALALSLIPL